MQHARAGSGAFAAGASLRGRAMSALMALCLVAAVALAIPGFAARAADGRGTSPDNPFVIPERGTFPVQFEGGNEIPQNQLLTGFWGVVLDDGAVTPTGPIVVRDMLDDSPLDGYGLWMGASLGRPSLAVSVPSGTNNKEGVTWQPGEIHTLDIVVYSDRNTRTQLTRFYVSIASPTPEPTAEPTSDPSADPTPQPTVDPVPDPTNDPTVAPNPGEPTVQPTDSPVVPAPNGDNSSQDRGALTPVVPEPDDPNLPAVRPTLAPTPNPSASSATSDASAQPSGQPVSPITDISQLTDANKGGVSAAFVAGRVTINVPTDKAAAGEWVSANIMQTGDARWLQVEGDNRVSMDVTDLAAGEYKVVVATRSNDLIGWAEFKVAAATAALPHQPVDASGTMQLHAEMLSESLGADASEGLNGYLLGAGACMLILGGLVVVQVMSGPKLHGAAKGISLS